MNQSEVIAFLRKPANHAGRPASVEVIETHGAMVFLAGDRALKIKRDVKFPYLDFSTLVLRHETCLREVEINRRTAPGIYRGVIAITRQDDGSLAIDGDGEAVEWAVDMHRFDQKGLLARVADRGEIDDGLIRQLAETVAAFHASAETVDRPENVTRIREVIDELTNVFQETSGVIPLDAAQKFSDAAHAALDGCTDVLERRAANGCVRRCHGDLHLNNIVLLSGRPVMFDAIEFSDSIASIDTLYDLAFLIMDLDRHDLRHEANLLLNRYLHHTQAMLDLEGLSALPLFLACRAGIRAMVTLQRAQQMQGPEASDVNDEAMRHFERSAHYLEPHSPRLIAVGGFSGTGKTTLSAALAPLDPQAPGAIHLRSDLERKAMAGVDETTRLGAEHYTAAASGSVYDRLMEKAAAVLAAGRSVIVDAVFAEPDERDAVAAVAAEADVPFTGLWLTADPEQLRSRVRKRRGDASDATAEIVDRQVNHGAGAIDWVTIDASGGAMQTLALAREDLFSA